MAKVDCGMLCLAVVVVLLACSEAHPTRHRNHNNPFRDHITRVNSFACSAPQRRLIPLRDLDMVVNIDSSYYPSATVLRRCDCATGYCSNPEHTCSPDNTEIVELVFMVVNRVQEGVAYLKVNATDHISCSCQPTTNQIK